MTKSKNTLKNYKQRNCFLEVKNISPTGKFSGYASIFGIVDSHADIITRGAFRNSIKKLDSGRNVKLLWQHKTDEPIGVFTKIEEDEVGLYVEAELMLDIQKAREAYSLLRSGAVNGLSIGFSPKDYYFNEKGIRIINDVDLWEISVVTFPANQSATISSVKQSFISQGFDLLSNALDRAILNLA